MSEKSIIVIGAGIAGLSAGCYGQMNGYRVQIYEQDTRPGGLCTSWERNGYTINGGVAFLGGSGPRTQIHRVWEELGVVSALRMIDYDYFGIVEGEGDKKFHFHADLDRLERHMKDIAPEDSSTIDQFVRAVRIFTKYQLPFEKAPELLTPLDKMKLFFTHLPLFRAMGKWKKVSVSQFVARFKNPFLRYSFLEFKALFSDNLPMAMLNLIFAWSHMRSAGYPQGGALEFSRTIEKRFRDLGGGVKYRARVEKILVEDGRAVGIRLADGTEYHADHVVSAADGRTTLFHMLDGKFNSEEIDSFYEELPVASSVILVALGVSRQFPEIPHSGIGLIFFLKNPVKIGGIEIKTLRPMIYNYDPTLAPEGKTYLRVVLSADYDYWKNLQEAGKYREEKEKVATTVTDLLEQRFPGISADIEMVDVATPLTFERYTGNWKGSIIGWDLTTETAFKPIPKMLPGLQNFWMAGQWVEVGGGIPMVALSGRNVIQLIARADKKPFKTESCS